jgi:hypothetical protein
MAKQLPPENPLPPTTDNDLIGSDDDTKLDKNISTPAVVYNRKRSGPAFVSSISKNEPVVTRRELWSYYRMLFSCYLVSVQPVNAYLFSP